MKRKEEVTVNERNIGIVGLEISVVFSVVSALLAIVGIVLAYEANAVAVNTNRLSNTAIQRSDANSLADRQ
ncbi:MAG: hypothetical protein NTV29_19365 [Planctomycetota bacterium]|nr:hypothetical protein [Planctomycetota bacterium]